MCGETKESGVSLSLGKRKKKGGDATIKEKDSISVRFEARKTHEMLEANGPRQGS